MMITSVAFFVAGGIAAGIKDLTQKR